MNIRERKIWLLWGMITAGLIFAVLFDSTIAGNIIEKSTIQSGRSVKDDGQATTFKKNWSPRRNPFIPLTIQKRKLKPASKPKTARKRKPVSKRNVQKITKAIYAQEASKWKLMGVMHGQYDQYAIIDFGDAKRIFVKAGTVLDRLGWVVQSVHEDRVVLTPLTHSSAEGDGAQERILRFSPLPAA